MIAVSAGGQHTCALTSAGGVECWGSNVGGELGDGITPPSPIPVAVTGLSSGVKAISSGFLFTCAITNAGGVECWGDYLFGAAETPTSVSGLTSGVIAIATGFGHTCALTNVGGVDCWGYNTYGQLGDGTTYNYSAPQPVVGLSSGVTSIAAGDQHTCAILSSGSVECWGYDYYGQLGNGTSGPGVFSPVPVPVTGLSGDVTAISGGDSHTCAITTSKSVECWGFNAEGQLGNGTTTYSSVPVPVTGLSSGVTTISAGYDHSCALTSGGSAECWGDNTYGELGNARTTNSSIPVAVQGPTSRPGAITTGYDDTCALTNESGVECWGYNGYGELGNDTTINSSLPTTALVEGFDTVSFNSEGGQPIGALVNLDNATVALPTPIYSGSSYIFAGWNTAPDGSGMNYPGGSSYTLTGSLTLYAQWLSTAVILPSTGANLTGMSTILDATASAANGISKVQFALNGGPFFTRSIIGTAVPTLYGYVLDWNTTSVPNGTYTLQSLATEATDNTASSVGFSVSVTNPPPTTAVVIPSTGASLLGTGAVLDASASSGVTQVRYELSGGPSNLSDDVIAIATPTFYGWLASWDTTAVPNGSYTLESVASYGGGVSGTSSTITISVNNTAPTSSMLLPANDANLSGNQYLDASASSGVTQVRYELSGGPSNLSDDVIAMATPTLYGWLAGWNTATVPDGTYSLQSLASYGGGVSGTSSPISVTVNN